jgi:6-pyruvoyl-tetrahydropterin synthase
VVVTVKAEALNSDGMVMDFSELKIRMNEILDGWDHAILLQKGDPLISVLEALDQRIAVLQGPPTAELLARNMHFNLTSAGLDVESVTIYETEKNCATVRF